MPAFDSIRAQVGRAGKATDNSFDGGDTRCIGILERCEVSDVEVSIRYFEDLVGTTVAASNFGAVSGANVIEQNSSRSAE
ncbi:MAG: hypothetical protein CMJ24_03805 [Phycisphaerae bacterium]|nr:hypothetical protein [Phycisphaerae bacterium]